MASYDRELGRIGHSGLAAADSPLSGRKSPVGTPASDTHDVCPNRLVRPLSEGRIRELARIAAGSAPFECCGLVLRDSLRPCRNVVNPRLRKTSFAFSAEDAIYLAEHATDGAILAIYHSHPDGPADWSARDERDAWFGGHPLYSRVARIIVGCHRGRPDAVAAYGFVADGWRRIWRVSVSEPQADPQEMLS